MTVFSESLNPCENLNSWVDGKIGALEQEGTVLRSTVEDLRKELTDWADVPSTQSAIDGVVGSIGADDVDAGSTALTNIKNFTGTCVDPLYDRAKKYAAEIDHGITDKISDISSVVALPEGNLVEPLRALRADLGFAHIESLVAQIDEKLGCLSGQGSEIGECLSIIDNFMDRVDDVLTYLGFGVDGTFDLDDFVGNFGIPIDASALTNLKSLDTRFDEITTEAVNNIKSFVPASITPQEWF